MLILFSLNTPIIQDTRTVQTIIEYAINTQYCNVIIELIKIIVHIIEQVPFKLIVGYKTNVTHTNVLAIAFFFKYLVKTILIRKKSLLVKFVT